MRHQHVISSSVKLRALEPSEARHQQGAGRRHPRMHCRTSPMNLWSGKASRIRDSTMLSQARSVSVTRSALPAAGAGALAVDHLPRTWAVLPSTAPMPIQAGKSCYHHRLLRCPTGSQTYGITHSCPAATMPLPSCRPHPTSCPLPWAYSMLPQSPRLPPLLQPAPPPGSDHIRPLGRQAPALPASP